MHSKALQSSGRKGKRIRWSPRKIRSAAKVAANIKAASKRKWCSKRSARETAIRYSIT